MTIKTPVKALRSWEPYFEPDADELAEYMAQPFTRIEDADGESIINAHDCFEFKPGHAERIVACLNAWAGIPAEDMAAARAAYDAMPKAITLLQRQRDEMARALSLILSTAEKYNITNHSHSAQDHVGYVMNLCRNALAQVPR